MGKPLMSNSYNKGQPRPVKIIITGCKVKESNIYFTWDMVKYIGYGGRTNDG